MVDWISHNSKIVIQLIFLSLNLISAHSSAESLSINVYLKVSANEKISPLINRFNQLATQKNIYRRFAIEPYIKSHPLHVTLYLSNYDKGKIKQIVMQVKKLARSQTALVLESEKFIINSAAYMMLSVKSSAAIQKLSLKTLQSLAYLRNHRAQIPLWASKDPQRQKLFEHYGSPNVLQFYQPHLSILSAAHLNSSEQLKLSKQLQKTIKEFLQIESTYKVFNAQEIGIGIADKQGQIIEELASFSLKKLI